MKKANDIQIGKVQFQVVAYLLVIFLPMSALRCLAISAAYKKKRVLAVAERYLIITHIEKIKNKRSSHQ